MSRCQACGRPLRRPSPSGLGPVCARRLGITPARPSRPAGPVSRPVDALPEIHPDQTALDLQPMQPSLWSL